MGQFRRSLQKGRPRIVEFAGLDGESSCGIGGLINDRRISDVMGKNPELAPFKRRIPSSRVGATLVVALGFVAVPGD
jgi:hypothetical protein